MPTPTFETKPFGVCKSCGQKLLLNPENYLCIHCELDRLKEQIADRDVEISQYRRKISNLYAKLNAERAVFSVERV